MSTPSTGAFDLAAWVAFRTPEALAWRHRRGATLPVHIRAQWIAAFRAARVQLVRRAPECNDYPSLMYRCFKAIGREMCPLWEPPTVEEQRDAVDRALARLWADVMSSEA